MAGDLRHTMNLSTAITRSVCLLATWLASVAFACAQPVGANLYSPEWLAAEARVVVRAVVDEAEKIDGSHCIVTLRVLEALKGEPGEKVQFVCSTHYGAVVWSKMLVSRQQLVVFLDEWQRKPLHRGSGDYAYTRFPLAVNKVILLSPDKVSNLSNDLPVYDREMTPQRTPAMLSETIRRYLAHRKDGELLTSRSIELPPELRGSYYAVGLTVPAEPTAEKMVDFATFKERVRPRAPC